MAGGSHHSDPGPLSRLGRTLRQLFARRSVRAPDAERVGAAEPAGRADPGALKAVENYADDPQQSTPTPYADPDVVLVDENNITAGDGEIGLSQSTRDQVPDRSWSAAAVDLRRSATGGIMGGVVGMAGTSVFAETTKVETLEVGAGVFGAFVLISVVLNVVRLRRRRR